MNFKTRTTYDSLYTLLNYVGTFWHENSYILVEIYLDGFDKDLNEVAIHLKVIFAFYIKTRFISRSFSKSLIFQNEMSKIGLSVKQKNKKMQQKKKKARCFEVSISNLGFKKKKSG